MSLTICPLHPLPGRVWCGSEEVDTGLCGVLGQDGDHTGCGAEASGVHADAALLVPEDAHHYLCCDAPCRGRSGEGSANGSVTGTPAGVLWPSCPPLTDLDAAAAAHTLPGSGPWQPPCAQAAGSGRRPLQSQRCPAQSTNPEPWRGCGAPGVQLRCLYQCSAGWKYFGRLLRKKRN